MSEYPNLIWLDNLPDGWEALYRTLLADLAEAGLAVTVVDAKEKFGRLRVYLEQHNELAAALIATAERRSARTCQQCGAEGELMVRDHYYATLCPLHGKGFDKALQQPMVSLHIPRPEK